MDENLRSLLEAERQRSARLLAVVRAAEWSRLYWVGAHAPHHMCPLCHQAREWGWGHAPDCPIGVVLKETALTEMEEG